MTLKPLIARQAILNTKQDLFGYELLFRGNLLLSSGINNAQSKESYQATISTLIEFFTNLFTEGFASGAKLFVNFTKQHLIEELPLMLPAKRIVVEILEGFTIDDELIKALKKLKHKGYMIALDDYEFDDTTDALLPFCDIVKVDIEGKSLQTLTDFVNRCKPYKCKLLAERVETQKQFFECKELGFNYFQGYFFSKPNIIKGKQATLNQSNMLSLLNELMNENIEVDNIEHIIANDPELIFRLLAMVNSLEYRGIEKITSLKAAIVRFGLTKLKSWILLFLSQKAFNKPDELIKNALVRAKFFELLSAQLPGTSKEMLYLFGILSHIDALMDQTMETLIGKLNIDDSIKQALLYHKGSLFNLLRIVEKIERGNFEFSPLPSLSITELCDTYRKSIAIISCMLAEMSH